MRLLILAALPVALAGCGSLAANTDAPGPFNLVGQKDVALVDGVQILDTAPAGAAYVSGTSCTNKPWNPPPSRENALELMKKQAKEKGFNAVGNVEVGNDPRSLLMNCWSAITAKGRAFNVKTG